MNISFELYSVMMRSINEEHAGNIKTYEYFANNTKAMRDLVALSTIEWEKMPVELVPTMGNALTNMRAQGLAYCKAAELILKGCDVDIYTLRHTTSDSRIYFEVVAKDCSEYHRY